ncbi:hypothetical protein [Paenibacillus thiaminolyticus]|uniref:hypothetical protein n=1 Tax=Paenibacillus thiaminolyticus TaxID=49283 RepID=UPI0035A632B8
MNKSSSEAEPEAGAVREKRSGLKSKKERPIAGALLLRFYSVTLCSGSGFGAVAQLPDEQERFRAHEAHAPCLLLRICRISVQPA